MYMCGCNVIPPCFTMFVLREARGNCPAHGHTECGEWVPAVAKVDHLSGMTLELACTCISMYM